MDLLLRNNVVKKRSKLIPVVFFGLLWVFMPIDYVKAETMILNLPEITTTLNGTYGYATNTFTGTMASVYTRIAVSNFGGVDENTPIFFEMGKGTFGATQSNCVSATTTPAIAGLIVTGLTGAISTTTVRDVAFNVSGSECFRNVGDDIGITVRTVSGNDNRGKVGIRFTQSDPYLAVFTDNEAFDFVFDPPTTPPTPTIQTPKNIEILNPTYGTTTASTTFSYQIRFKTPFSIDFRPTTTRTVIIEDALTGNIEYIDETLVPALTAEDIIMNRSASTPQGSKFIRAFYKDLNGNLYSEMDEVFFNVATNTYKTLTGLDSPRENPNTLSQIDCNLFDLGCQFQKVLVFIFVPPQNSLDKWGNLWQGIGDKVPFGYFTVTKNALTNLNDTSTSAFDLGNIPFMNEIFTPFRALMGGILWAIYAIYFYQRRLIHLDI